MVDIHSHILPGIDDGSQSLEESVAMLRIAEASGTTGIAATPHANLDYPFDPQLVESKLAELNSANPTTVRIHSGCDFHLAYDLIRDALANPRKYTINHGPYLLIELPDTFLPRTVPPILESLLQHNMWPILSHPERYYGLRGKLGELKEWIAKGCLVQLTGQSLLGDWGAAARAMSEQLLDADLVHFMASDAHRATGRTPSLTAARAFVADRCGERRAVRLFESNPGAAVDGVPLPPPPEPFPSRSHRWFPGWK